MGSDQRPLVADETFKGGVCDLKADKVAALEGQYRLIAACEGNCA